MTTTSNPTLIARRQAPTSALKYSLALIGCILALKALVFWGDHFPMFYLGDSVSYLDTATMGYIPPDRSFVYGLVIRLLAVTTHSLTTLLAAQTLASSLAALACAFILRRYFNASRAAAAITAVLCALEPLQLMYERYVMTEAFSLLFFALFTTIAMGYLKYPTLRRIVLVQVAGVFLICFRVSFLPLIEAATVLLPVLASGIPADPANPSSSSTTRVTDRSPVRRRWTRAAGHLFLSALLFLGLHAGYKRLNAELIKYQLPGAPPAYNYENGLFLLTFVAPIVKPCDFPIPERAGEIFDDLAYDLTDHWNRSHQRWAQHGLITNLIASFPDPLEANRLAEQTAWNAIKRDPWGELSLAITSFADYWKPDRVGPIMLADRGDRELPPELLGILKDDFGIQGEQLPHLSTITNRYFFSAWVWYLLVLLSPLSALLLVFLSAPAQRPAAILLLVFASLQIVVISVLTAEPTVRFLHSIAWLNVLILGALLSRIQSRISARRHAAQLSPLTVPSTN